jgi:exopolyphosphatase/guanosine-5'-triphosphate,3'-diphosphate pyrophosphatase
MNSQPVIAVIDLGTNSVHLLVGRVCENERIEVLDEHKVLLRLGRHLGPDKLFSKQAIELTVAAFQEIQAIASVYKPIYRAIGTYACRAARNHHELFHAIEEATGIPVELIDGLEEARLVGLGIRNRIGLGERATNFLAVDCGGGSTEILIGNKTENLFSISLDLGALMLTEKFELSQPTPTKLDHLHRHIIDKLEPLRGELCSLAFDLAIASSSVGKTLALIHAPKKIFDLNGHTIPSSDLLKIVQNLGQKPGSYALEERRAELALAGAFVISEIGRFLKVPQWTISTSGLREGALLDTIPRLIDGEEPKKIRDIRHQSVEAFAKKTKLDPIHSESVTRWALGIFDGLQPLLNFPPPQGQLSPRDLLWAASRLHECGKFISFPRYHKHSHYLILHSCLPGFSQHERELIGLITRYQRKNKASRGDEDCRGLTEREIKKVNTLSGILRLAVCLNRTRGSHGLGAMGLEIKKQDVTISVEHDGSEEARVNLDRGEKALGFLSQVLDRKVSLWRS